MQHLAMKVHADEVPHWDQLHAHYNHAVAYSLDGACTNQAESFSARLQHSLASDH